MEIQNVADFAKEIWQNSNTAKTRVELGVEVMLQEILTKLKDAAWIENTNGLYAVRSHIYHGFRENFLIAQQIRMGVEEKLKKAGYTVTSVDHVMAGFVQLIIEVYQVMPPK